MLNSTTDDILLDILIDLINLLLRGELPLDVKEILYDGRLIAPQKKDGSIGPIAVGYTTGHPAAKCANKFVIKRSHELQLTQTGMGVAGGAETAIQLA